jgi:uncharacterized membrane protein
MISVGNGDVAEFCAILLMTMTLMFNFYTIEPLFYILTGKHINYPNVSPTIVIIILFVLVSVLYLLLGREEKILEIKKKYENESKKDTLKGRILIICYIVLSYVLLFSSVYLVMMKNRGEL